MRRGTTPRHVFKVGTDLREASMIFITYEQDGQIVVEKTLDDILAIDEKKVTVALSQKETLRFKKTVGNLNQVFIQMRAGFADGSRASSKQITTTVDDVSKDGEI